MKSDEGDRLKRRHLVVASLVVLLTLLSQSGVAWCEESPVGVTNPWERLPAILEGIKAPTFPEREFPITSFGAVGDGRTDATAAIRAAIAACAASGGGHVVVPPGDFLTGSVHLKSNVDLHLEEGATLRFSRDPNAYLPVVLTRWEGVELMNYSPLVYAFGVTNVAVTGKGTLDGQAGPEHWWPWKLNGHPESQKPDRDRLFAQAEAGVPVDQRIYGAGHFLRPSFVQTYRSRNILIEDVTIKNAPMWIIHPVLSQNVTVRGVKVISSGPNNDGCNPESSTDVLIEDSLFDTGDDCIAIKSGRNADGRRLDAPSERIVVRGCRMRAGHGGVTIGSEVSGSVRDVFVEQTEMSSPDLDRGIRIKTNAVRGGVIENIFVRDVEIGETGAAIHVDMLYEEGADGPFEPLVRNILVERLTVRKAKVALYLRGLEVAPLRGVTVRDSVFHEVSSASVLENVEDLELHNVVIQPVGGTSDGASSVQIPAPASRGVEEILLWPGEAPGSEGLAFDEVLTERGGEGRHDRAVTGVLRPTLSVHRPLHPNGAAVLVAPGGGYHRVVIDKEGRDIAEWLNGLGVTVFLLKYRLPEEGHLIPADVPLQDAQRAIRVLRHRSDELGIDRERVGVLGFSAGGHLVASLAGYHESRIYAAVDEADGERSRPDFMILIYPVVDGFVEPDVWEKYPGLRRVTSRYPLESAVSEDWPPTFVLQAADDPSVSVSGALGLSRALWNAGVPAELHVFQSGGHGFGIRNAEGPLAQWTELAGEWIRELGFLVPLE